MTERCTSFSVPFHYLFTPFSVPFQRAKSRLSYYITAGYIAIYFQPFNSLIYMENSVHHNHTISHLADEYLASLAARNYSAKSVAIYRQALENLQHYLASLGRERPQDITASDLENYRLDMVCRNFAPSSLEVYLRTVRQWFKWLEQNQRLFANPAAGLLIPKPPRKLLPAPTQEQIRQLLLQPNVATRCGVRDRALLETAYTTGIRREELYRLTVCDLDLDNQRLRVLGKGRKERMLPLGKHALQWLRQYIAQVRPKLLKNHTDESALWINQFGKRLDYNALQQLFFRHSQKAGITPKITPHSMRRACATHMLQNGAHPVQLQLLLGHSTLRTLGQYLRLTVTELQQAHARTRPGR